MFKEIQSGLSKFFGKKWIPIILILVVCFVLLSYSSSKGNVLDIMSDGSAPTPATGGVPQSKTVPVGNTAPAPAVVPMGGSDYALHPIANPSELLPKDVNSEWSQLNPIVSGNNVAIPDLLTAGYHTGIDTIGQSLRNPSYDLRSDPIIPPAQVGPWNQSTITPDYARVPLEIGVGSR